jgi:hypothetical protein
MVDMKRAVTLGIVALAFGFGLHKAWQQPNPGYGFRVPVIEDRKSVV